MTDHQTEADARIVIDDELRQAGWDPADKSQVQTEVFVRYGPGPKGEHSSEAGQPAALTADGDVIPTGRADYVLLNRDGQPLAVIEAKSNAIHPYIAKQQALPYAKTLDAPFIFLTNGELIYFWDYLNDDARVVDSFYSQRDLERILNLRKTSKAIENGATDHIVTTVPQPMQVVRL